MSGALFVFCSLLSLKDGFYLFLRNQKSIFNEKQCFYDLLITTRKMFSYVLYSPKMLSIFFFTRRDFLHVELKVNYK